MVQWFAQWTATQGTRVRIPARALNIFFSIFPIFLRFQNDCQAFKYFCMTFERLLECLVVPKIFLKLQKLQNVCQAFKQFCMTSKRLLKCLKVLNIFLKLQKLQNVCQAFKYFCMTSKRLLECLKILNIFLKQQKLQDVCQACRYFSMTSKRLMEYLDVPKASAYFFKYLQTIQYFLKLLNIFLEFVEAKQNPLSFRIFFQVFKNNSVLPEVVKHFSRISGSHTKSPKLQNIFSRILKHSSTS